MAVMEFPDYPRINQELRAVIADLQREVKEASTTLRDQFAMAAITPLLTGAVLPTKEDRSKYLPMLAEVAYEMADAMMAARAKEAQ